MQLQQNLPAQSSPSRPLIEAMIKFHQTVGKIGKGGKAQYGKYANLKDILEVVNPALTQSGLVLTQTFEPPVEPSLPPVLVTRLIHVSGDFIESKLPMIIPKGRGNAMHDFGGAITYLKRYALLPILGLEADMEEQPERLDDDGDRFSPKPVTKSAPAPKIKGIAAQDQKLTPKEIDQLVDKIKKMPRVAKKPGEMSTQEAFCKAFRAEFKVGSGNIQSFITAQKHKAWIQAVANEYS